MADKPKKQRTPFVPPIEADFDKAVLARIAATKPGAFVAGGSMTEYIKALKPRITKLHDEGYTPQQIAYFFTQGTVKVTARTVTTLLSKKSRPRVKKAAPMTTVVKKADTTSTIAQAAPIQRDALKAGVVIK